MKKFVGFLLALAMMASMVIPAMAAGEPDVLYDAAAYQAQTQESVNKAIVKAGGKLNQINVKLNDKCIAFPDAVPELQNGSTMVPVRALMEALGAKVTMDKNTVTIVLGTT
ncbi:MAG: Copper amine oxidase N-terminal domain, partial [Evtepia sp.]|nr:Copper amine oxidase N-terminal domain [Evtepia sp.]